MKHFDPIQVSSRWEITLAKLFGKQYAQVTEGGGVIWYYMWRGRMYITSYDEPKTR